MLIKNSDKTTETVKVIKSTTDPFFGYFIILSTIMDPRKFVLRAARAHICTMYIYCKTDKTEMP